MHTYIHTYDLKYIVQTYTVQEPLSQNNTEYAPTLSHCRRAAVNRLALAFSFVRISEVVWKASHLVSIQVSEIRYNTIKLRDIFMFHPYEKCASLINFTTLQFLLETDPCAIYAFLSNAAGCSLDRWAWAYILVHTYTLSRNEDMRIEAIKRLNAVLRSLHVNFFYWCYWMSGGGGGIGGGRK